MRSGTSLGSAGQLKLLLSCRDWYHSHTPLLFSTGSVHSSYRPTEIRSHLQANDEKEPMSVFRYLVLGVRARHSLDTDLQISRDPGGYVRLLVVRWDGAPEGGAGEKATKPRTSPKQRGP